MPDDESYQPDINNNLESNKASNNTNSSLFTSKIHRFEIYLNQEMQQKVLCIIFIILKFHNNNKFHSFFFNNQIEELEGNTN
jgi:hypothetical protein